MHVLMLSSRLAAPRMPPVRLPASGRSPPPHSNPGVASELRSASLGECCCPCADADGTAALPYSLAPPEYNVVTTFGARGDGESDDTAALQVEWAWGRADGGNDSTISGALHGRFERCDLRLPLTLHGLHPPEPGEWCTHPCAVHIVSVWRRTLWRQPTPAQAPSSCRPARMCCRRRWSSQGQTSRCVAKG